MLSKGKKKDLGERLGLHLMAVIFLYIPPLKKIPRKHKRRLFPPVKIPAFLQVSVVSCIPEHLQMFNPTVQ